MTTTRKSVLPVVELNEPVSRNSEGLPVSGLGAVTMASVCPRLNVSAASAIDFSTTFVFRFTTSTVVPRKADE